MGEQQEFIIEIYRDGVVIRFPVIGIDRYLKEKTFLAAIAEQKFSKAQLPRPVPDPRYDFYLLKDDQYAKYLEYRRELGLK